jgi:enamine deaminase RidA (YjgF/YER057c/UK114 family)
MVMVEQRLAELGVVLPPPPKAVANYVSGKLAGNLFFLSGQGPRYEGAKLHRGKVGGDVSVEVAYQHARLVGLQLLAAARHALGDLDRVKQVVKLLGMVNAVPEFRDHPAVINGCSDLFTEIFGEAGRHARSAVGMGSLPENITVEIEAIFEVEVTK